MINVEARAAQCRLANTTTRTITIMIGKHILRLVPVIYVKPDGDDVGGEEQRGQGTRALRGGIHRRVGHRELALHSGWAG